MKSEERKQVASLWLTVAAVYGKEISPPSLSLMIDAVSDLSFESVMGALSSWPKTSKQGRHPFPVEIREFSQPTVSLEAQAREAAARIPEAITRFGWPEPDEAKEFIGELGWRVVERFGGWMYICENLGLDLNPLTFQAQARDLAKAQLEYSSAGRLDEKPTLSAPADRVNQLLEFSSNRMPK